MDDSTKRTVANNNSNNRPKSNSSSSISTLYHTIKYNLWSQVCQNYTGPYAITTRREIFLNSLKCNSTCQCCKKSPCEWARLGDKVIDVVFLKMEGVYNKKDMTIHLLEPTYFRKQLLQSYLYFAGVKDAPKCVFFKYYALFPDKQIKVNNSNSLRKLNEYINDNDLPWHGETSLFNNL